MDLISNLCTSVRRAVRLYYQGYPGRAFDALELAMHYLIDNLIRIYQQNGSLLEEEGLNLFRVRNARKVIDYSRTRSIEKYMEEYQNCDMLYTD